MSSALEVSVEKRLHHLDGLLVANEATRHCKHIGIVVLARKGSHFRNPAKGCTDALVLVESHADALSAAAHGDAGIAFTLLHSLSARVGEVGIVSTVGRISAEILVGYAF